jgi:tetratricopeptide (TPR) repeat protein
MDVRNARSALRDVGGQIWNGRAPHDGPFRAVVRVAPPTTTAESGLRYILEAEDKASRNEFTVALQAYARAAEANPQDLSGMLGMAHMYRRLNRLNDAIPLYERAFNASNRMDSILGRFLALAYVASGQENRAIDALRNTGLTEAEVQARVQELRERARAERLQPER